ncbi:MAG TPA: hypothetical protein VGL65_08075 [Gemmatimonadales bacterium]
MTRLPDAQVDTRHDRRGVALPLVLLLTLMLTISVGAAFVISGNEHETGTDHDAGLKAYAVAQEGVERYLTDVTVLPTTLPDTRTIAVTGGTATVTLNIFRTSASSSVASIYVLTSVGQSTAASLRRSAATPVGQRTISQMLTWQTGTIDANAAFTSLSGLNIKNGSSGTVSGVDVADPVTGCAGGQPSIAGLAVPNSGLDMNGNGTDFIDGNPDNTPVYIGTPGPTGTAVQSVDVDWAGILAGSIAPDFVLDRTGKKSTGSWPSSYASWPVVLVKGNITNGDNVSNGEGVLIVTGDADLSNFIWHGIVMVGGAITLSGSKANVWGSLFTGLNEQLGQTVGTGTVGNGNVEVQYNSCDISEALLKFGGWRRVQNTWTDNWPSYPVP